MLRFPIDWTIRDVKVSSLKIIPELVLKDGWKIVWKRKIQNSTHHSIEIWRTSTIDNVHISGTLFLTGTYLLRHATDHMEQLGGCITKTEFGELMESGSSHIEITVNDTTSGSNFIIYNLGGVMTITSVSNLLNGKCRKCDHLAELSNDLGRLLDPETCCFADVNLKCGDESIPAHKIILSARSPVFAAMFRNPMKENYTNEVVIRDIDASVLRYMLAYVYMGNLSNLTVSSASDLLLASDKYQVGGLKRVCCEFLKDNISTQNVLRILFLGELHCNDLKSCAMDYICNTCTKFSVLEGTEEWKTMKKERPDLALDIMTSIVKAKEKKRRNLANPFPLTTFW